MGNQSTVFNPCISFPATGSQKITAGRLCPQVKIPTMVKHSNLPITEGRVSQHTQAPDNMQRLEVLF